MAVDKHPRSGGAGDGEPRDEAVDVPTRLADRRVPVHWFAGRLHEVIDELVDPFITTAGLDAGGVALPFDPAGHVHKHPSYAKGGTMTAKPRLTAAAIAAALALLTGCQPATTPTPTTPTTAP